MLLLRRLLLSEDGGTALEYGIIAVLVSVSFIAAATLVGNEVGAIFNDVGDEVSNSVN